MQGIKKKIYRSIKNVSLSFGISLLLMLICGVLFVISRENQLLCLVFLVLIIFCFAIAIGLIVALISSCIWALKALSLFKKRGIAEGIDIEEEEFETIHKNFYVSANYIVNTFGQYFIVDKKWIIDYEEKTMLIAGNFHSVIEINTGDKKFSLIYKAKRKEDYDKALSIISSLVDDDRGVQQKDELALIHEKQSPSFTEKSGRLNLISFIIIALLLFSGFGFGYTALIKEYGSNHEQVAQDGNGFYRNVVFKENGEIYVNYDVIDDITYLYFTNNSSYAFKAKVVVSTEKSNEKVETLWIRPQGFDYLELKKQGIPTQYEFSTESYRQLLKPTDIKYRMFISSIMSGYVYDVVIDDELTLNNGKEVSVDEAVYSVIEDSNTILYFYEMDINEFETENPESDLSTLRYEVVIDINMKTVTIYEADKEERNEIERFNFEEVYHAR